MSEDELKKTNNKEESEDNNDSPFNERTLNERLNTLDAITESFAKDELLGQIQTYPDVKRTADLVRTSKKASKNVHRGI